MKKSLRVEMKKITKFWWIILAIVAIGVLLRTYNFHDWLRFNADQGRDSELVSRVIEGKERLPLLGPKAGGTEFKLGPAFYYGEIVAAKIFGNAPDKMAFPDLITGILCIPLLFVFARKYFEQKIALALSAVFAVSNYAIRYSRFAWNPNSTPFWTMLALYALAEVINEKQKRKYLWSLIAGLAIGIGVQLHTTVLLFLPLTTLSIFGYLTLKNKHALKYFFLILFTSLLLNVPQFVNEYQQHGANMRAFLGGMEKKQEKVSVGDKLLRSTSCWVQGNMDIISGYEISDTCNFKPQKSKVDLAAFALGVLFVLGGTLLGLNYLKTETDPVRKGFLALVFVYMTIAYLIFVPLAFELSVRFYLALIFVPFLLLGFWMKFLLTKIGRHTLSALLISVAILAAFNLFFVQKTFKQLASYQDKGGTVNVVLLSQVEDFANFIKEHSDGSEREYVTGNEKFLFKAYKPLDYLVTRANVKLLLHNKKDALPNRYFYIARSAKREALLGDSNATIIAHKTHGRFTILLVEKAGK